MSPEPLSEAGLGSDSHTGSARPACGRKRASLMIPFNCSNIVCDNFKLTLTPHCYDSAAHLALELLLMLEDARQMACMLACMPDRFDSHPCPSNPTDEPCPTVQPWLDNAAQFSTTKNQATATSMHKALTWRPTVSAPHLL